MRVLGRSGHSTVGDITLREPHARLGNAGDRISRTP
jgi:acetyl-CoA carboxylase beta subunit